MSNFFIEVEFVCAAPIRLVPIRIAIVERLKWCGERIDGLGQIALVFGGDYIDVVVRLMDDDLKLLR